MERVTEWIIFKGIRGKGKMILLLEDDAIKGSHELQAIREVQSSDVRWEKNLADGIAALQEEEVEWVLLDMYFPLEKGEPIWPECGLRFLREIRELGYGDTPVIVCSTVQMRLPSYENVLDCICYREGMLLEEELRNILSSR